MRLVFIAGPDRCGKTTLTDEFVRRGFEYRHFGPPKGSPYGEYLGFAEWLRENGRPDGRYVVDRFMYCEFPYSRHYGRRTDMDYAKMLEIEGMVLYLDPGAVLVYCATDLRSNWRRICDEGKREFEAMEQLEALRDAYEDVLRHTRLRVLRYDFTAGDTPRDVMTEIRG